MDVSNIIGTVKAPVNTDGFQWKIDKFKNIMSNMMNTGTPFYSPVFYVEDTPNIKFRFKMCPSGKDESSKGNIDVYLGCFHNAEVNLGCEGLKTVAEYGFVEEDNKFEGEKGYWRHERFFERKHIINEDKNMLTDDTFTMVWRHGGLDFSKQLDDSKENISVFRYYEELLANGKFSDVTVVIGADRLPLHKSILSSISPVFRAMFDHDMSENSENKVVITDIEGDVAKEMFRYVYCREVNNIDVIVADLFAAADKYCITRLKELCERSLLSGLCMGSAFKCLTLVTMYETTYLKSKVIDFVVSNLSELVKTPEYKQLSVECKDEIIMAMAIKRNS